MVNAELPAALALCQTGHTRPMLPMTGETRGLASPIFQRQRQLLGHFHAIAAAALGLIERGIRCRQQHLEFGARRPASDADADGRVDRPGFVRDTRTLECLAY